MVIDKPQCGLDTCKYYFDGNCTNEKRYRTCEFAYFKQLEATGRLIELPCKVGDTAWVIDKDFKEPNKMKVYEAKWTRISLVQESENSPFEIRGEACYQIYDYFYNDGRTMLRSMYTGQRTTKVGEVVFLTKEEAEVKLKKLKGE